MSASGGLLEDALQQPITTLLAVLMSSIWFLLWNWRVDFPAVAMSYETIVHKGEYWRALSASLCHISLIHLGFNVISLWSTGVERIVGPVLFLKVTFLLLFLSVACVLLCHHMLIRCGREHYLSLFSLGFSCVLFGWMTILAQAQPSTVIDLKVWKIPISFAPFGSLIFTQLLVPRASLIGHASGILLGYLYSFGVFFWFSNYWFVWSVLWVAIFTLGSLRITTTLPLSWIQVTDTANRDTSTVVQVVNGVIARTTRTTSLDDVV